MIVRGKGKREGHMESEGEEGKSETESERKSEMETEKERLNRKYVGDCSVLRSQSFHGPVLTGCSPRAAPPPAACRAHIAEADQSSDNDF
ncbi:hypothetical protein EVAR_4526_1 [Eumeta japonica]|uniref:Uncharacterized protein n=1 Tax=Eumeta variegata TaxID=151549 RepID=A0A4C1SYW2_EUMVA|nr:hypothetical protein EVAR_4526_1 [Eumeta japonica]